MKRMDILCASQASTAITLGGRAIDRHNPIINGSARRTTSKSVTAPCSSSQPPIHPRPCRQKAKKNDSKRDAEKKRSILNTPPGSARRLLSDAAFFDGSSSHGPVSAQALVRQDEATNTGSSASASHPKSGSSDQVVVLRVSLHCKGCEGKVRKHLSRMQGVTSFNIDFAAKKVTVVGDVTPSSVLASISKVKNAQFWPAPASALGSSTMETRKNNTLNPQINPLKI